MEHQLDTTEQRRDLIADALLNPVQSNAESVCSCCVSSINVNHEIYSKGRVAKRRVKCISVNLVL